MVQYEEGQHAGVGNSKDGVQFSADPSYFVHAEGGEAGGCQDGGEGLRGKVTGIRGEDLLAYEPEKGDGLRALAGKINQLGRPKGRQHPTTYHHCCNPLWTASITSSTFSSTSSFTSDILAATSSRTLLLTCSNFSNVSITPLSTPFFTKASTSLNT